ncbi:MAG TPA: dinitrogenase iron-molybdenum cofactor biosynthesis protein [Desulfomonilaceae bacterium]|nr:dinitrogenase iron-molybdenum cofactor biosynthesis protein [Desulfomonilaceae bacterium]
MKKKTKTSSADPQANTKILIPLLGDDVAPRFDLAPEALVAVLRPDGTYAEERTIILSEASAEELCRLVLTEKIDLVVCCGIDDEYYQYLNWKKVKVVDSVIGSSARILDRVKKGTLQDGDNLLGTRTVHSSKL